MNIDLQLMKSEFQTCNLDKYLPEEIDLVVSGGGLSVYYTSLILLYLHQYSKIKIKRFSGVSAGAIVCVLIIANLPIEMLLESYKIISDMYSSKNILATNAVEFMLNKLLPENIAELCNDTFFIAINEITITGLKKTIVSQFKDKKHVIDVVIASSSIPFITTLSLYKKLNNKKYIDGFVPYEFEDNLRPQLCLSLMNTDYPIKYVFQPIDLNIGDIIKKGWNDFNNFCDNKECHAIKWHKLHWEKKDIHPKLKNSKNILKHSILDINDRSRKERIKKELQYLFWLSFMFFYCCKLNLNNLFT
jgi:hypothetical protein